MFYFVQTNPKTNFVTFSFRSDSLFAPIDGQDSGSVLKIIGLKRDRIRIEIKEMAMLTVLRTGYSSCW